MTDVTYESRYASHVLTPVTAFVSGSLDWDKNRSWGSCTPLKGPLRGWVSNTEIMIKLAPPWIGHWCDTLALSFLNYPLGSLAIYRTVWSVLLPIHTCIQNDHFFSHARIKVGSTHDQIDPQFDPSRNSTLHPHQLAVVLGSV